MNPAIRVQIPAEAPFGIRPMVAGTTRGRSNHIASPLVPPWLSWQSARLLTDRSLVRAQVEAAFCIGRKAWHSAPGRAAGAGVGECSVRKCLNTVRIKTSTIKFPKPILAIYGNSCQTHRKLKNARTHEASLGNDRLPHPLRTSYTHPNHCTPSLCKTIRESCPNKIQFFIS